MLAPPPHTGKPAIGKGSNNSSVLWPQYKPMAIGDSHQRIIHNALLRLFQVLQLRVYVQFRMLTHQLQQ